MNTLPEICQWVVLVKVHHSMNQHLKKMVGMEAKVIDQIVVRNEVRIQFNDPYKSTFWVKPEYLELQQKEVS